MEGLFTLSDNNKKFYKLLISLCIPIIIQQLISTSVNIIDTVMSGLICFPVCFKGRNSQVNVLYLHLRLDIAKTTLWTMELADM